MPFPAGHNDRRRELLTAWERRCRARSAAEHCSGADALFLVTALSNALRTSSETPELGRAARTWGARFSAPVEALAALTMLRDALTELSEDSPAGLPVPLAVLNRVFDQATMEAVDAASGNLRSAARHDPLTGCANRRALDEDLAHSAASARRSNLDLAVAVVDLDGLKQINDTQGHAAGDAALLDLVASLRRALREADTLYRTGGDEFVVVAPFTDAAGARALMRRAERQGGPAFSWGVASLAGAAERTTGDPAALMDAADSDLYHRRRASRRAVVMATRRRRMTAVASVAASVAVTGSMAALAVAMDSGKTAPAADGIGPGGVAVQQGPAPQWPAPTLAGPGAGQSTLSSETVGTAPVGQQSTSLVDLFGLVLPPSTVLPALPAAAPPPSAVVVPAVSGPVISLAKLGGPAPGTIATGAIGTTALSTAAPVPAGSPAPGPSKGSGNGNGSGNANGAGGNGNGDSSGGGNGGGSTGGVQTTAPTAPASHGGGDKGAHGQGGGGPKGHGG